MNNYKKEERKISSLSNLHQQEPRLLNIIEDTPSNKQLVSAENPEVLFIEPFYGGSHKQLIDILRKHLKSSNLVSLTSKKWHWRARCSSLIVSSMIPPITTEQTLFCSSVLNLPELLGLRPDLIPLRKIVYFHENQMVYPIRDIKKRDVQFAYNQITTSLSADYVMFNSHYNKNSFLDNIKSIVKLLPDYRPQDLRLKIEPKCVVLYFPLSYPKLVFPLRKRDDTILHITWPHRWEFDKDPETFLNVLLELKREGCLFKVSILGEIFTDVSPLFEEAKDVLKNEVVHFGYVEDKEEFYKILQASHVAVSTAKHEFFGVSMMEASYCGCFPLVPNRLVYPEIYPERCLYENQLELCAKLKKYCSNPRLASDDWNACAEMINFDQFDAKILIENYLSYVRLN